MTISVDGHWAREVMAGFCNCALIWNSCGGHCYRRSRAGAPGAVGDATFLQNHMKGWVRLSSAGPSHIEMVDNFDQMYAHPDFVHRDARFVRIARRRTDPAMISRRPYPSPWSRDARAKASEHVPWKSPGADSLRCANTSFLRAHRPSA